MILTPLSQTPALKLSHNVQRTCATTHDSQWYKYDFTFTINHTFFDQSEHE